jgi:hypothetical protein
MKLQNAKYSTVFVIENIVLYVYTDDIPIQYVCRLLQSTKKM